MPTLESVDKYFRRDRQGGLRKIQDHEVILQRVENALLTEQGEIPLRPDYGSRLRSLLWEFKTQLTAQTIKDEIKRTVRKDVPEAEVIKVEVDRPDSMRYGFLVTVTLNAPGLSVPDTFDTTISMGE